MAMGALGALFGLFFVDANKFDSSSIPQFWLALGAGCGLVFVPIYFARNYYMLIYDPDSYLDHREGRLKQYMPKTKITTPDLELETIEEWFESYKEMQESKQWSDATLTQSEIDLIKQKVRVQHQKIILK